MKFGEEGQPQVEYEMYKFAKNKKFYEYPYELKYRNKETNQKIKIYSEGCEI
jgi:hypothetical protein